ncbi:MAG: hypothetical protein A2V83_03590 [Nitrospirae bacterium RBG_16_64_22]|nr:MAG: hypothetical protein A2V83_03590 [Nitrospirae bacterium RBG_16_64_22]
MNPPLDNSIGRAEMGHPFPSLKLSGAILAGGENRRMPVLKPFLDVGGECILDRTIAVLGNLVDDLFIVTRTPSLFADFGVRCVPDSREDRGPLTGIEAALEAAVHPRVLVAACDMPDLSVHAARRVAGSADNDAWAVIPRVNGRLEPLFALYDRRLLPRIGALLTEGRRAVHPLAEDAHVRVLEVSAIGTDGKDPFRNINTPSDLVGGPVPVRGTPGR